MNYSGSAAIAAALEGHTLTTAVPDREPDIEGTAPKPALPRLEPSQPGQRRSGGATVLAFPAEKMAEPPPDITRWAGAMILATMEALHGVRSPGQLRRWYDPRVHAAVAARAARTRVSAVPPRVVLRSARASFVADTRVEASGVVEVAGRCRAVAVQMQTYDGRWRVTALEIG